ncbi:MAG TPA: dienelactone hydrolase family protein [Burkholderiaceae bacterium]|jgi:carboxymethylenebutenolidase|nr:dienelactone hydrolase family protein [Burkholderiaceae bacterium]
MAGQYIDIRARDGSGSFRAYLATPPSGKGPAIVVAQEIFGINPFIRDVADHYAAQGYVVAAPDLFWRQQPGVELGYTESDWQQAFKYMQGFSQDKGVDDIAATVDALRQRPDVDGKVGCVGFCLGGKMAYLTACRVDVAVSVGYYGVGIENNLGEAERIKGHLVLHIAENDKFVPPEAQKKIVDALKSKPNVTLYTYPGVDHAFARPPSEHYDEKSAKLANQRTLDAFRQHLGSGGR